MGAGGDAGQVACLDVPAWFEYIPLLCSRIEMCNTLCSYWDLSVGETQAAGGGSASFSRQWTPPAAAAFGAAVCACSSGGVTCVAYASGRVVALVGEWEAPVWVWDEGGRVTCACMHGGCVVWGLGDGGVCVGCVATGECVRWARDAQEACDVSTRFMRGSHRLVCFSCAGCRVMEQRFAVTSLSCR